jgi:hypothetical protein
VISAPLDFADTSNGATLPGTTLNGADVNSIYYGPSGYSFSMYQGSWTAVGAIFSNGSELNTANRPDKSSSSGSTWFADGASQIHYMVIDLGQSRTFTKAFYYQMFSDGKTTHAAMDVSTVLRGYADAGWTSVHSELLLGNGNGTVPTQSADLIATFPSVTGRYVRLQLRNDGRYGSQSYVELFKIKIFE